MLSVRCKICNKELTSNNKTQCYGCPNMTTLSEDKISSLDLSKVLLLSSNNSIKKDSNFSSKELEYQENRRKRKVRKLDFEVR